MKRTGNIAGAWLWGGMIALVIITQIIDFALATFESVLVQPLSLLPLALLLAFLTALVARLFVAVPRTLVRTNRTIRAALRNNELGAPRPLAPLDPSGALNAGETLTLTRIRPPQAIRRSLTPFLVIVVLLVGTGTFGPSLYLGQSINDLSVLYPWLAPISTPLILTLIGIPLIAALLLLASGVWDNFTRHRGTITADDRGISVTNALNRTRFIPWDDIKTVIRASGVLSDPAAEQYTLWGAQHGVFVNLVELTEVLSPAQALRSQTEYVGGRERYMADARRLLATLAARCPIPLRIFPRGYYGVHQPLAGLGVGLVQSDIATAPLAAASVQPDATQAMPPFAQSMWATTQRFTLAARTPLRGFINTVRGLLLLTLIVYVTLITTYSGSLSGVSLFNLIFFPLMGFMIIALVISVVGIAIRRGYSNLPAVVADNAGLRVLSLASSQRLNANPVTGGTFVPWQRIQSWAVIPPSPGKPNVTVYVVFWDGPTVTWVEREGSALGLPGVQGDAREAYRQAATALHAMVAARTGLPLHELPQPRGW